MKTGHAGTRRLLSGMMTVLLLSARTGAAGRTEPRAFILDAGTSTVIALDTEKAEILGTLSLEAGSLKTMIQIPRSKRLAVFDQGPGKGTLRFGWHPQGRASVSFVEMDSMKVVSRLELGWGIGQVLATRDGKTLAVVCPGYASQKPEETLPAEVVLINTETNTITGRFPVKPPAQLMLTPDNRTLVAFTSASRIKDRTRTPEIQFADCRTARVVGTVIPSKAVTSAELSADGRHLYLLDPGEPSDDVEKNVNGFLVVVSVPDHSELDAIDVGSAPQDLIHDAARDYVMILSDDPPFKEHRQGGVLRVWKGTDTIAVTPVAYSPLVLTASPDGAILYVVGPDTVTAVDASTFKTLHEIHIEGTGGRSYRRGGRNELDEFTITPDGKRAIALFANSDKVTVLDLDGKKSLASLRTGRGSARFMQALAVGLSNYSAMQSAQNTANETGTTQYYTVQTLKPATVDIAVSDNGRFAYALNSQTKDVTVIDVQAATVLSKIPTGEGLVIQALPGANAIALPGLLSVTFIDTNKNEKIRFGDDDRLKVGGLGGLLQTFRVSPSGNRACALVTKRVICIDTATMKEVGRQEHLKNLEMMLFER